MNETQRPEHPLLSVRNLHKEFVLRGGFLDQLLNRRRQVVRAVDGVDFDLASGRILGLVGESGSGKSTLGYMVALLEESTSGTIEFDGQDVSRLRGQEARKLRRKIQIIFQNPYESMDPRYTVGAWIKQPLNLLALGPAHERQERVFEALEAVDLRPPSTYVDRFGQELSGGQRQRVGIARAIVVEPQLLVADEPVSMLDVSVQAGIMNLMLTLQERIGLSYIFISHDLAVARYMANEIAVMYLGKIVEFGPVDPVIERPAHPYTKLLLAAVPRADPTQRRERVRLSGEAALVQEIPSGCRFHPRCPLAQDICIEEEPPLRDLGGARRAACHFSEEVLDLDQLPIDE